MEAYLDWQNKSGGIKLNDVIEEFKYVYKGQEVKAGDFVNYIEGLASKKDYGESVDTQLSMETNSGYAISAVQLDENRVFVAHSRTYNASANTKNLYGMVVIINGATITYGADKEIVSSAPSGTSVSACKLSNDRVFLAYPDTNNNYLYGIVVTIEGNTVKTSANSKAIVSVSEAGINVSTCLIAENKIFIAHRYGNNYLYGIVVTISGTTITTGADTVLVSTESAGYAISTCLLPNGNVFIAHSYGSNLYLYGMVVSISGTAITKGTDTQLVTTAQAGGYISTQLLPNGNVFAAYRGGSGEDYCLYGMVVSINGTTISKGIDTQLSNLSRSGIKTNLALLDNGQVLIIHSYSTNNHIYGIICSINGTTITAGTDTMLNNNAYTSYALSTLLLDNGTIFTTHSHTQNSYYLHAQIFGIDYENNIPTNNIIITEYEQQVTPAIEPPFNAIALSSGVGAPEFVEGEVKKTGNIFPTNWTQVVEGTKYSSSDGYILEANSYEDADYKVCNLSDLSNDGTVNSGSAWRVDPYLETNNHWASITCPKPTKITKMKTYFNGNTYSYTIRTQIQGKKNSSEDWVDLATLINGDAAYIETTLSNTDFYDQYRLYVTVPDNFWNEARFSFFVWEVLEYVEIQQIPSTEHNEQVKIARVYKEVEVEKTGDIVPKTWTYVSDTEYVAEDGARLITSSYRSPSSTFNYEANLGCDGVETTYWFHALDDLTPTFTLIFPTAVKVLKMNVRISFGYIENLEKCQIVGSNDGVVWKTLYDIEEQIYPITEIVLSNPDFYKMYRVEASYSEILNMAVYELQTSEYIVKEVIQ